VLEKITAMALDILPDNHPGRGPIVRVLANLGFARSRTFGSMMAPRFDKPLRDWLIAAACTLAKHSQIDRE
jgi:hypothetical protein